MRCPLHDTDQPCHVCGIARVRAALAVAPKPTVHTEPTTTLHELAIVRARAERKRP